tara:strand:- start:280 stop:519 length:240 start_codon:yes stop_codon:yes gene_type:complete
LLRLKGRDGAAIIDEAGTNFHFDPERPAREAWTRTTSSEMDATIDDKSPIKVVDCGFRYPFDGFLLRDMALWRIRTYGI